MNWEKWQDTFEGHINKSGYNIVYLSFQILSSDIANEAGASAVHKDDRGGATSNQPITVLAPGMSR